MYVFVWVCAQRHAGVWGPEADSRNLPQLLSILLFEQGLSLSPEFSDSARLVAQTAGICLFPLPSQLWCCRRRPLHPAFHVASRDPNSGPQAYTTSSIATKPSPQPHLRLCLFLKYHKNDKKEFIATCTHKPRRRQTLCTTFKNKIQYF